MYSQCVLRIFKTPVDSIARDTAQNNESEPISVMFIRTQTVWLFCDNLAVDVQDLIKVTTVELAC